MIGALREGKSRVARLIGEGKRAWSTRRSTRSSAGPRRSSCATGSTPANPR